MKSGHPIDQCLVVNLSHYVARYCFISSGEPVSLCSQRFFYWFNRPGKKNSELVPSTTKTGICSAELFALESCKYLDEIIIGPKPLKSAMQIDLSAKLIPCNTSDVITVYANITSSRLDNVNNKAYDHVGAMEFIVATLLVYCLLGIAGLLLLRVRRRASRSQRTVTLREEHLQQYIKQAEDLRLSGYRDKLKIETKRIMSQIETIERRKSETNSVIRGDTPVECDAMFSYSSDMITTCHVSSPGEGEGARLLSQDTTLLIEETEEEDMLVEPSGADVTSPLIGPHSTAMKLSNRSTVILKFVNSGAGSLTGTESSSEVDSGSRVDSVMDNWSRLDTDGRKETVSEMDNMSGIDCVSEVDNVNLTDSVGGMDNVSGNYDVRRIDNVIRMDNDIRVDNAGRMDSVSKMDNARKDSIISVIRMDNFSRVDNESDTNNNQNRHSIHHVDHRSKRVNFLTK